MHTQSDEIIAIVDDDQAIRVAIAGLVRSMGWQAELFESALAFLQSPNIARTACVVSDVRMPGMSGVEMHDRLLQLGYRLPTIFVTAFPIPELDEKRGVPGVIAILLKPIDPTVMAEHLERALAASGNA
ncbi:response regulator transcription factor [Paraburkholderia sp. DHOC27]|uniref:response regulator transcription factor n=1 Tax=Paraburkholderia sp. DHOC27 TaxID=2303330 RepID=UPI000E3CF9D1|nr:response regulator [Paraburkholderia sp. DHOC27]RFU49856.1 response regulator [Paraburkholderia sp. DHOC27]